MQTKTMTHKEYHNSLVGENEAKSKLTLPLIACLVHLLLSLPKKWILSFLFLWHFSVVRYEDSHLRKWLIPYSSQANSNQCLEPRGFNVEWNKRSKSFRQRTIGRSVFPISRIDFKIATNKVLFGKKHSKYW